MMEENYHWSGYLGVKTYSGRLYFTHGDLKEGNCGECEKKEYLFIVTILSIIQVNCVISLGSVKAQ